jgi:uncharacterized protein YecE (DUF72 family)
MQILIGSCGWGYFRVRDFYDEAEASKFKSVLQAYANIFPAVEINSTFYRIPKISTAEKWKKEAAEVNENFEFTVKASGLITHKFRFAKGSLKIFNLMKSITKAVGGTVLLFQSPASFSATEENKEKIEKFFTNVDRDELIFTWEPRGNWHKDSKEILKICKKYDIIECVDPFRNEPLYFGKKKIAYFRLHGLGTTSMYMYNFSKNELEELKKKIDSLKKKVKKFYVFFNNSSCYENSLQFMRMLKKQKRRKAILPQLRQLPLQ